MSDDFKQIICGQDSQEYGWKDVPVEHKEIFRQLPAESSINDSSLKMLKERKTRDTRPDPSPLEFNKNILSVSQCYITPYLKAHLKVECQAMIIEKNGLS